MAESLWGARKTFRVSFEAQAAFRVNRSSKNIRLKEKTIIVKLLDLSVGGCSLESSDSIPSDVKLNIFFDRQMFKSTASAAKKRSFSKIVGVVRSCKRMAGFKFRLGVQFEKLSLADAQFIRTLIEQYERRQDKRLIFPQ